MTSVVSDAVGAGTATDADLARRLEEFVASAAPDSAVAVTGLRRSSLGLSRENWSFDLVERRDGREGVRRLILRRDPLHSILDTDRELELAVLHALEPTGIPAPRVVWDDLTGATFGRPALIMVREPGECDYLALNREQQPLEGRLAVAHQLWDILAGLHALPVEGLGLAKVLTDPGPGTGAAEAALRHWEAVIRREQLEPFPELELPLAWLRQSMPEAERTVLVHGDFKPGNALLQDGRVVALLDWETAHLGDPVEDVAWALQPLRRREQQIPGHWEAADARAYYEEGTGTAVSDDSFRWWTVLACLKASAIALTGLRAHVTGRSERSFPVPTAYFRLMLELTGLAERSVETFLRWDNEAVEGILRQYGDAAEPSSDFDPDGGELRSRNARLRYRLASVAVDIADDGGTLRQVMADYLTERSLRVERLGETA
jgi:aminoglycoside phosphotransferase (APT) family kinase protein